MWFWKCNLQPCLTGWYLQIFLWWCPQMNATGPCWWSVNIGSGSGLVPSGNKPLPEPELNKTSTAIWRHWALLRCDNSGFDIFSTTFRGLEPLLLLLLKWFNFNPSSHISSTVWDEIIYPFPNFNGCTVDVWEWISNFIPHTIMTIITHSCRD